MKAFSIIFGILAVICGYAFITGGGCHWVSFTTCLAMAFVAWPDKREEDRYGR